MIKIPHIVINSIEFLIKMRLGNDATIEHQVIDIAQ